MKKILALVFLSMMILGCTIEPTSVQTYIGEMTYVKDQRTNLCFALLGGPSYGPWGVTIVPCEKVEKFIK